VFLRRLKIERFRSLADVEIEPSPGVTLFWGANAQGKTNLLEAVHYLATGRSFRTRFDREVLPWGAEAGVVARIAGRVEKGNVSHNLAIAISERAKTALLDGKVLKRLGDLLGRLIVVLVTPEDIGIASGSPALRRRFLDMALSQASRPYLHFLQSYVEALRQRNAALRGGDSSLHGTEGESSLDPWADVLVEKGVELSLARREAVRSMAHRAAEAYKRIAPGDPPLAIEYRSGAGIGADDDREAARQNFRRRLAETAQSEIARGRTLAGPHLDDIVLAVGGRDIRTYGSQGQKRSAALALRLAEIRWLEEQTGSKPVLLVDELGSELDRERRHQLLGLFRSGVQTLATTARDPESVGEMIGADRVVRVVEGALFVE